MAKLTLELVEIIKSQWSEDEIFELIKELDEEMGNYDFTEKLFDYFHKMYRVDLVAKANAVNGSIEDQEEIEKSVMGRGKQVEDHSGRCLTPSWRPGD